MLHFRVPSEPAEPSWRRYENYGCLLFHNIEVIFSFNNIEVVIFHIQIQILSKPQKMVDYRGLLAVTEHYSKENSKKIEYMLFLNVN